MTITKELRESDYYLFIDFRREPEGPQDLPCSLFTHQELALAHHLRFENIIALKQEGAPVEGFLRYVLSNPESFSDDSDLLDKLRRLVGERHWTPDYTRNLEVSELRDSGPITYSDHTGPSVQWVWQAWVRNKRPDVAAVRTVCILDYIKKADGNRIEPFDRSPLKWAGQLTNYERTILPQDYGDVDLFAIRTEEPGLFLHSGYKEVRA